MFYCTARQEWDNIWSFFLFCSFIFLFVPWCLLEKPGMAVSQIQFNFWIFFSNALCALALNVSIFLVIGRTGAVTIRVAGVLKDWILIALSTVVFPESTITGLNIIGYAIGTSPLSIMPLHFFLFCIWEINLMQTLFVLSPALCGVVMYNYIKVKDGRASQLPSDSIPERLTKVSVLKNPWYQDLVNIIFYYFGLELCLWNFLPILIKDNTNKQTCRVI